MTDPVKKDEWLRRVLGVSVPLPAGSAASCPKTKPATEIGGAALDARGVFQPQPGEYVTPFELALDDGADQDR